MCKSSSLIFVLLFAFLFRLEKFSLRLVGVIALTFSGVVLMVATETHFVLVGLILVLIASALGGFRWALTQLLLKNKKMGMDHPVATIFWLSPVMGLTLGIISMVLDDWSSLLGSKFFTGFETVKTIFFLVTPGVIAFCMVLSEFTIIQRAGIVPMSIAGIAKEVTTISMSAVVFGDPLTFLNMVGVAVTICGIALFTYHKYRKSLESDLPLDAHGNPVDLDDSTAESHLLSHELDETARLTRDSDEYDSDDDGLSTNHTRTLFSADEDQDAEELRSIRSSKLAWNTGRAGREEPSAAP
ncbi:unnamed protein product [Mycena citricolor]|nr:unnamed protein product [Mycena citricolor]